MPILECRDLTKRFGVIQALDMVNLTIEPGRVIGLLGPNGSGKTTLLKLANGLLTPTGGEVLVNGKEPGKESRSLVSYLPDKNYLPDWMKARQLMDFYDDFYDDFDRDRAKEMLLRLNISEDMRIKEMSKGTREKVQLILTMSRKAQVYLLDEPIAGVDPAARDYIIRTIISNYNPEAMVLISTHLIADIEAVLDEVIFLKEGRIVLHENADDLRTKVSMSVDEYFREVFRC